MENERKLDNSALLILELAKRENVVLRGKGYMKCIFNGIYNVDQNNIENLCTLMYFVIHDIQYHYGTN